MLRGEQARIEKCWPWRARQPWALFDVLAQCSEGTSYTKREAGSLGGIAQLPVCIFSPSYVPLNVFLVPLRRSPGNTVDIEEATSNYVSCSGSQAAKAATLRTSRSRNVSNFVTHL